MPRVWLLVPYLGSLAAYGDAFMSYTQFAAIRRLVRLIGQFPKNILGIVRALCAGKTPKMT